MSCFFLFFWGDAFYLGFMSPFSKCPIAGWRSPGSLEIHLKTKKIREREKALAAKKIQRTKVGVLYRASNLLKQ